MSFTAKTITLFVKLLGRKFDNREGSMFELKITYKTGNSFGSEITQENIPHVFKTIDIVLSEEHRSIING